MPDNGARAPVTVQRAPAWRVILVPAVSPG